MELHEELYNGLKHKLQKFHGDDLSTGRVIKKSPPG